MAEGIVKFFDEVKGFGFITPCDGSGGVFVHISAVQSIKLNTLLPKQKIHFETVVERGRPAAKLLSVEQ